MWKGTDLLNVIEKYNIQTGKSFYAYDMEDILQKIKMVKGVFKNWKLLYSMKANPNPTILREIISHGVGIDASSCNEVLTARACGCSPENIYYSAPGKSVDNLMQCLINCTIIADSINEVKRLVKIAKQMKMQIKIGIRVNIPNNAIIGNAFEVMSGVSSKFGINPNEFEYLKEICEGEGIIITGLHIYFGSQILSAKTIANNLLIIAKFALELSCDFGLEFVNFGGGFGVPYRDEEMPLDIQKIFNHTELKDKVSMLCNKGIRCNLELGRYLVAESGVFCTSVEDIKESFGNKYIILSTGINGFFRPVFTKEFHKLEKCKITGQKIEKVTIAGNLCTPIDQYYSDYPIEKLNIGDWLWFHNAGAYGFSMSMLDFISREKPLEIFI